MTPPDPDPVQLDGKELIEAIDSVAPSASPALRDMLRTCGSVLRREMDKSQRFLDTVETIIVGLDRRGRVTLVNRKGCELLGYAENELLGCPWFTTCLPDGSAEVQVAFRRIMAGELEALDYFENEVLTRSGKRRMVAWHNSYMRDSDEIIVGTLSAGEDITARKLAEERNAKLLVENRRLMQRLFEAQETERQRLARELHDELGQWLSAVQAHAQLIVGLTGDRLRDIHESAAEITASVDRVLQNVRRMIRDLRPVALDAFGLEDSVGELVAQWEADHAELACRLDVIGVLEDLDEPLAITIYRIIQEALTNVAKHAGISSVLIEIRRLPDSGAAAGVVSVTISDDGRGMLPEAHQQGMGLLGMRERVLAVGGTYELDSNPGEGVRIRLRLPAILRKEGDPMRESSA